MWAKMRAKNERKILAENQAEKIERKIVAKNFCAGTAIPYTTKTQSLDQIRWDNLTQLNFTE